MHTYQRRAHPAMSPCRVSSNAHKHNAVQLDSGRPSALRTECSQLLPAAMAATSCCCIMLALCVHHLLRAYAVAFVTPEFHTPA